MPDLDDVRRIALSLEGVQADADGLAYRVNGRLFVWVWLERVQPKKRRVPNPAVVGIRVRDEMDKRTLLEGGAPWLFTEPHYDGYPAVLVALASADMELLEKLILDAWAVQRSGRGRSR